MKRIANIIFVVCVISSTLCFAENRDGRNLHSHPTVSNSKDFPNIFRPVKDFFKKIFGKREEIGGCTTANVIGVDLNQTEIFSSCSNGKLCSRRSTKVKVYTHAIDSEGDVLTYAYQVSAGKIVGLNGEEIGKFSADSHKMYVVDNAPNLNGGANVVWDLSGVPAGTYTITAAVDDGCGYCGTPKSVSVTIKECTECGDR